MDDLLYLETLTELVEAILIHAGCSVIDVDSCLNLVDKLSRITGDS